MGNDLGIFSFKGNAPVSNNERLEGDEYDEDPVTINGKPRPPTIEDIEKAKTTKRLNLSCRNLKTLPSHLNQLDNLISLDIGSNNFKTLPLVTAELETLTHLDLSCNNLKMLPNELRKLEKLDTIVLSHNGFTTLPQVLLNSKIKTIEIEYNALKSISLDTMEELHTFKAAHNQISTVESLGLKLKYLELHHNQLQSFPPTVTSLMDIDLSVNEITEIPTSIDQMQSVYCLKLTKNQLKSIPPEIGKLQRLRELHIRSNYIAEIPSEFKELTSLKTLDASNNKFSEFSSALLALPNLTYCSFAANNISEIPDLSGLTALSELILSDNNISTIHPSVYTLTSLRTLFLSYNKIEGRFSVLRTVKALPKLQFLGVSGNGITSLEEEGEPTPLGEDAPEEEINLRELYASNNKISSYPDYLIDAFKHFKVLDLGVNDFTTLSERFIEKTTKHGWLLNISYNKLDPDCLSESESVEFHPQLPQTSLKASTPLKIDTNSVLSPRHAGEVRHYFEFETAVADMYGRRESNEDVIAIYNCLGGKSDCHLFAVFDGHGGRSCAALLKEHLHQYIIEGLAKGTKVKTCIKRSFQKMTKKILESDEIKKESCGATAVVALFIKGVLYVANVGDARAVICTSGKATRLSLDHTPKLPEEQHRIRELGGYVTSDGRVNGRLAVSRAFGDLAFAPLVSSEPFINKRRLFADDNYLILACDGVWDVISDQQSCDILLKPEPDGNLMTLPKMAFKLRDSAYYSGSTDNISVVVVKISCTTVIAPPGASLTPRIGRTSSFKKKLQHNS